MAEFKGGYLYVRSDDNSYKKLCRVTDAYIDTLAIAKKVIKEHIESAMCGIFDTRNHVGDYMETVFDEGNLTIDICYEYEYFEVFGLSRSDFEELKDFYETLRTEVRAKEKETTEMDNYVLMAEHGVLCIIKHQKQEETEICVKIIMHTSGGYEVTYKGYCHGSEHCYSKFYCGIPCLGNIRDDIHHFYWAECINTLDIKILLDTALGTTRSHNLREMMNRHLINSMYGLASADIRWPMIEWTPPTTAKDQYRNREMLPEISEVIFNKPATIVKWADGTKTIVKVRGKDRYNKEKGLAMAIAKKAMGNSNYYYTIMERYLEDEK